MLLVPLIYAQAPRLIIAIVGAVTIIPTALVLRRLLLRDSYPILNAIVILYFVGQLRILAASLPVLARFIFLGQVLGMSIFLVWVLRSWRLPPESVETHGRIWRKIRVLPKSGLLFCWRRCSQIFLDMSTWRTFWESYFSGALTSRPRSIPPFASSKD